MKTAKILIALAAMSALGIGAAQAADVRTACKTDYKRYCDGVSPGGGRILKCLKENEGSLSSPCKSALEEAKEEKAKNTAETPAQ